MTKTHPKTQPAPSVPEVFSFSAPVSVPRGDGSYVVSPGKPVIKISVAKAAARAGVSIGTIYRLIDGGFVEAEHPSPGRITVIAESLEKHLAVTARDQEFWATHALVERRPSDMAGPGTKTKKRPRICPN